MDDKSIALKRHGSFVGLTDGEIQQIAADCELLHLGAGDVLHRAGERLEFFYLIVQGRLKQTIQDASGNEIVRRYLGRGSHFGGVAAAQADPVPMSVVAVEPSRVLRLEYEAFLRHLARIPRLLANFIRDIGTAFKQTFTLDRGHSRSHHRAGRDEVRSFRIRPDEGAGRDRPRDDRGIHREDSHGPGASGQGTLLRQSGQATRVAAATLYSRMKKLGIQPPGHGEDGSA